MQTTYIPPELSTIGRCGFVVGNLPTCGNKRAKGSRYCKQHIALLAKQDGELVEMAKRAALTKGYFPGRKLTQIYFIRERGGAVKIGKADNVKRRLAGLQTAHAYPLDLLAAVFAPAHLEEDLHEALAEHRLSGEWFSYCHEIEILVSLAKAGAMENIARFVGWEWPYRGGKPLIGIDEILKIQRAMAR
jgi:hypothetical protein